MIHQLDTTLKKFIDPMIPQPATIRHVTWETDDTFTLNLEINDRDGVFQFKPGQFNMVYVHGLGEAAISISSDPGRSKTISHTIHRVGTVTTGLASKRRGDAVGIRGPYGTSWPIDAALHRDVCIVAGGIGLAPLRPLLYTLFARRSDFGRIILLYGARTALDLLYRVELEQWTNNEEAEVLVTVDRGDQSWKGNIGVVTTLFGYVKLDARATTAFVCGPETMMKFTVEELNRRGVAAESIHVSMERNMKCAVGFCGHCQYGPHFICKDGPVFPLPAVQQLLEMKEL